MFINYDRIWLTDSSGSGGSILSATYICSWIGNIIEEIKSDVLH